MQELEEHNLSCIQLMMTMMMVIVVIIIIMILKHSRFAILLAYGRQSSEPQNR